MSPEVIGERIKILMTIRDIKRSYLAKKLGISYNTMTKKLNGQREFSIIEIVKIREILDIDNELCASVFFDPDFSILENGKKLG